MTLLLLALWAVRCWFGELRCAGLMQNTKTVCLNG
jgi:hypothetical protein